MNFALAGGNRLRGGESPARAKVRAALATGVIHTRQDERDASAGHDVAANKGKVAAADVHETELHAVENCLRVREIHVRASARAKFRCLLHIVIEG